MTYSHVLILAYLSAGQSNSEVTEEKWNSCHESCPPGHYKVDDCGDPVPKYRCEKCRDGTFTNIKNHNMECLRCEACGSKVMITPCNSTNDTVCDCEEGYFKSAETGQFYCRKCKKFDEDPNFKISCLNKEDCTRKCPAPTNPSTAATTSTSTATAATTSTSTATAATTSTSTATAATTASSNSPNPVVHRVPRNLNVTFWLFLVVALVTLLLSLGLLLLFARSPFRYLGRCLYCCVNKDLEPPLELPNFNEQSSHQGSSPDTLTLTISENTPMMTLSHSPAMPEHPAHISPPDAEHKATTQQSDRWPAIVLYAIIKEVPLRRWKEFLRLLSVTDQQLERVELEAGLGLGSMERQYQMLRLWSQCSSASLNNVFSALHYMDLSGCAQQLQESLEKLQVKGLK
ncbi:tumor necrosis factor receptor superfamily member 1A [Anarhichas minor]|uniref:tumor necrosis factor receptor superfamily member 1A n=1 Tax=Anarhichas minor TaxID=65739 RepID=UPI003F740671